MVSGPRASYKRLCGSNKSLYPRGEGHYHKKSDTCKIPCKRSHTSLHRRSSKSPYNCVLKRSAQKAFRKISARKIQAAYKKYSAKKAAKASKSPSKKIVEVATIKQGMNKVNVGQLFKVGEKIYLKESGKKHSLQ